MTLQNLMSCFFNSTPIVHEQLHSPDSARYMYFQDWRGTVFVFTFYERPRPKEYDYLCRTINTQTAVGELKTLFNGMDFRLEWFRLAQAEEFDIILDHCAKYGKCEYELPVLKKWGND